MAEPTLFELSSPGRTGIRYPAPDVPEISLPEIFLRESLPLPELSEQDVVRHYTRLSKLNYSVDGGIYPLGSCTMKYNPRVNETSCPPAWVCCRAPISTSRNRAGLPRVDV